MNTIFFQRVFKLCIIIVLVITSIIAMLYISKVAYPFIIATILAFLMNPLVNLFEMKLKLPRFLSVLITLFLVIGIFFIFVFLLVVEIISGVEYLSMVLPQYLTVLIGYVEQFFVHQIIPIYHQFSKMFHALNMEQQETITSNIENIGQKIATNLGLFLTSLLGKIPTFLSWLPTAATGTLVTLLGTFFISKDWYKIKYQINKLLPVKVWNNFTFIFSDLKSAFVGFIKAQTILISLTMMTLLIGFLILDIDYAITIALLIGLIDLIPYFGTGLVFIPWCLYELFSHNYQAAIGLGVLYLLIIVQRQVMEPKILSSNIGLHPLATLISVFIGYKLLGMAGLLLGPTILIILSALNRANIFKETYEFIMDKPK